MRNLLSSARGDSQCDLVIKGGIIANVLSMEYERADIAVKNGVITGVGCEYEGNETVDASGAVLMPGMIDGHLHIESTMLTPARFASVVVPLGTTTVMPDPHEIANTSGVRGIEFMWRDSLNTPLDSYFAVPSCVPASMYETPYEELGAEDMMNCCDKGWCTHLGEMMNFPGVISGDSEVWTKIALFKDMVKTAHAPNVTGRALCAYLMSGCDSDHESSFIDEALEKMRRGMWIMMREGATENNLEDLLSIVIDDETRAARCMAVSDDLSADHILSCGHMDHKVRLMIKKGLRPLLAAAMVTINPANYFRMLDRGAIAPGRIADIVMADSLEQCRAIKVWKRGKLVAAEGKPLFHAHNTPTQSLPKAAEMSAVPGEQSYAVAYQQDSYIRVIQAIPHSVLTQEMRFAPAVRDGLVVADTERDIMKLVVMEKNTGSGRLALGFVHGFGMKTGAIGSSVAHDAHNYIVMGADDKSIAAAMKFLIEHNGGLVAADGGSVIASLELPIGGLMSDMDPQCLAGKLNAISDLAAARLGVTMPQPFMAMSFLSLSVIPALKLTDRGYVNMLDGGIKGLLV